MVFRVRELFALVLDRLVGVLKVICKESAMGGEIELLMLLLPGNVSITH